MWTLTGTFAEACAFVQGFDAASQDGLLDRFARWLSERVDQPPQIAWPGVVMASAVPGQPVNFGALPLELDRAAVDELFRLLDEFLSQDQGVT